jgi:hypothetical protein
MKPNRAAKQDRVSSTKTPEQVVLAAYLNATKDRAFRAFVRRVLHAK